MANDPEELMRSIIERIATGPEMSKDIPEDEACQGMAAVLDGRVDRVRAALFLIALRMKRETQAENRGVFRALIDHSRSAAAPVDELLTIADPFNGFNRGLPMSPFVPAVLAACGLPCVSCGVETVAPKFGLTHHHILAAAGKRVDLEPEQAAAQVGDEAAGWAYLDQSATSPALHRLVELRRLMVKRPALSTCEVMLKPLAARRRDLACVGYVHVNYPPVYAMLGDVAGFETTIVVKGVEGGIVPSLQTGGRMFLARSGRAGEPESLKPEAAGIIDSATRAVPAPDGGPAERAPVAVEQGLAALAGAPGAARDSLVFAAAIALYGARREDSLAAAAATARRAIDSGRAMSRFKGAA